MNGSARNPNGKDHVVLELVVNNHPGVMSHICGLFSRRAFNVEGIVCMSVGNGSTSRIRFMVGADQRLDQIVKQVDKLQDVLHVFERKNGIDLFAGLAKELESGSGPNQATEFTGDGFDMPVFKP